MSADRIVGANHIAAAPPPGNDPVRMPGCVPERSSRDPDVYGQLLDLDVEGWAVRLWRATELERLVDADALLRDSAAPEPPYWMHLWPGALAAARVLARAAEVGPGARVLELGCGLGLPALVAARRGAAAVASDRQRAPLLFARSSAAANHCRLQLVQMDWSTPAVRARFDVCVGADIGYDRAGAPLLTAALAQLVAPGGVVWLADSVNTARDELTWR